MKTRNLNYKDLLNHNISQEELNQFLHGLVTIANSVKSPVTELNEVTTPFHNNSACFSGAYCYAIAFNHFKIIQALLAA